MAKAVFSFADSLRSTCQYPEAMSNVANYCAPDNKPKQSLMFGKGQASFFVMLFSLRRSMQNLADPSFLFANTTGDDHGEIEGLDNTILEHLIQILINYGLFSNCWGSIWGFDR